MAQRSAMVRPKNPEPTTSEIRGGHDRVESTSREPDGPIPPCGGHSRGSHLGQASIIPVSVSNVRERRRGSARLRASSGWRGRSARSWRWRWSCWPWIEDLPIRDPDDDILPSYIRMPLIVFGAILVDILPRSGPPGAAAVVVVAPEPRRPVARGGRRAVAGVALVVRDQRRDRVVPDLRDVPQHQEHGAVRQRRRLGRHDGRRRPVPLRRARPGRGAARLVRDRPDGAR